MSDDHLLVDPATPALVAVNAAPVRVTAPPGTTVLTLDPAALAVRDGVPELVAIVAAGPPGPPGGGGSGGTAYVHDQTIPSALWTVTHNLGYRPGGIFVEDTLGRDVVGEVTHLSVNALTIGFSAAFSGKLYAS